MRLIYVLLLMYLSLMQYAAAKRIGIIGGGIGGTASAYFLKQLLPEEDEISVDIFEPRHIGGRLRVIAVGGREYEAGGSIIHPRNKYMQRFVKELGLAHRKSKTMGKLGLFDGKEFLFKESSYGWISTIKMFWRYGSSLWTLDSTIKKRMDMFDHIYDYQDKGMAFKTTKELLKAMSTDFPKSSETAARKGFLDSGMTDPLVGELVSAVLRVNYGQSMEKAHEFVAFVSIAGAEGGLWAVQDGNYQVPKHLLESSGAKHIPHAVLRVDALEDTGKYRLFWKDDNDNIANSTYDAVIVATPITDELFYKIEMPDLVNKIPTRHMHRLVVTFVRGLVNYTTFEGDDSIDEIMCTNEKPWFNSLSRIYPVDGSIPDAKERPVYKVFSSDQLTPSQLQTLFIERDQTLPISWHSYPHYSYTEPLEGHFILRPGLFYLNAIEWAASAMEMSALSAKNMALLARNYLHPHLEVPLKYVASGASKAEL